MYKKRWGDRKDARWVRETPAMQTIMAHLYPNRTDCEAYLRETLDITELVKFLEKKNAAHPEYKTTVFHCLIFALAKMIHERPKMNYFVQGRRTYERDEISLGFVCRRRFAESSEEALMFFKPKEDDTLDTLSYRIAGEVHETRKSETATGGVDALLESFAKLPRILLMLIVRIVRWLDFWDLTPMSLRAGDPNFASCFLSNLGSVGCDAVYHHLNNYGSNSFFVTMGVIRKEEVLMPDGTKETRDLVDIGAIVDERIADGFYFARSLKLVKHMFKNPELLEETITTASGFDYK